MLNKFLTTLIICSSIAFPALGCDQSDLDSKAGGIAGKIYKEEIISKKMIIESLGFVYNEKSVRDVYEKPVEFESLWVEKTKAITGSRDFLTFADLCKQVYEEGTLPQRSGVHMLFEKVSNYVQDFFVLHQRRSKLPEISPETLRKNVMAFLNFDKGEPSNSSGNEVGVH